MNSRFIAIFKPEIINLKWKKKYMSNACSSKLAENRCLLLLLQLYTTTTLLINTRIIKQFETWFREERNVTTTAENENALVSSTCNLTYSFGDWILRKGIWHGLHVHIHLCDVITQAHNNHTIKNHGWRVCISVMYNSVFKNILHKKRLRLQSAVIDGHQDCFVCLSYSYKIHCIK